MFGAFTFPCWLTSDASSPSPQFPDQQIRPQPHHSDDRAEGSHQAASDRKAPAQRTATRLSQAWFRATWNDAKAEVGLGADDQVVPTSCATTCASHLVQGGIDIRRVRMCLGRPPSE